MKKIEIYTIYRYNIDIRFEWDENKRVSNLKKHKIDFEEAKTVFYDEDALLISDEAHSDLEERFVILGLSSDAKLLIVCHCYRENDNVIRIINARKATTNEAKQYLAKKVTL